MGGNGCQPAASLKPRRPNRLDRRFLTLGELNQIEPTMAKRERVVDPFAACTGPGIGR